jgi:hypothetical protein
MMPPDRDRDRVAGERREPEPLGRRGHLERLVGSFGVVGADPAVELDLGLLERCEGPVGQELAAERLMEPLDLAGRRGRAHGRVPVGDPVLPEDPVEQDLDRLGAEAAGEALAVVGEDLVRDPVAGDITMVPL